MNSRKLLACFSNMCFSRWRFFFICSNFLSFCYSGRDFLFFFGRLVDWCSWCPRGNFSHRLMWYAHWICLVVAGKINLNIDERSPFSACLGFCGGPEESASRYISWLKSLLFGDISVGWFFIYSTTFSSRVPMFQQVFDVFDWQRFPIGFAFFCTVTPSWPFVSGGKREHFVVCFNNSLTGISFSNMCSTDSN